MSLSERASNVDEYFKMVRQHVETARRELEAAERDLACLETRQNDLWEAVQELIENEGAAPGSTG